MKAIGEGIEIKRLNRIRTIKYILDAKKVSRQDIAAALGFSMPTVLQNVADLIDCGLVCEAGEYGSTGGGRLRRFPSAKARVVQSAWRLPPIIYIWFCQI